MNKYFLDWKEADETILYVAEHLEPQVLIYPDHSSITVEFLTKEEQQMLNCVIIPTEYIDKFNSLYEDFIKDIIVELNIEQKLKNIYFEPNTNELRYKALFIIRQEIKKLENNTGKSIKDRFIKHMGSTFVFINDNTKR